MSKCQNQHSLRVLVVHPGTQHGPRLAAELERQGVLWRYWTGVGTPRLGGGNVQSGTKRRRRVVDIPGEKLRTIPWVEVLALALARLPINRERLWHWRNGLFQKLIPQREIEAADVVVGFDTASWIIGERAKRAGKVFVLDQTVGHPLSRAKAVVDAGGSEETWAQAFVPRLEMVTRAERREHELADVVVAASSFSKKTLIENGVSEGKIRVIPYGVGAEFVAAGAGGREAGDRGQGTGGGREERVFRFLYAGYVTKRKGIELLFEAWKGLEGGGAELRVVGGGSVDAEPMRDVVFLGQTLRKDLVREMAEADVFVFPSLFEGFGLVLLEAMAAGLPVITTPNTAGPDLIEDGKEGLIVSAGDILALRNAMKELLDNPERARSMGRAAREKAKEFTWGRYGAEWRGLVRELTV